MSSGRENARGPRIVAWSDLHVDYAENAAKVAAVAREDHRDEVLLLPGDVTDDLGRLRDTLGALAGAFAAVFFVPGNHELWVRRGEAADAFAKLSATLELCESLGVHTTPRRLRGVWIVPLLGWYQRPEEGAGSLFVPKRGEEEGDGGHLWADDLFVRWPEGSGAPSAALLRRNEQAFPAVGEGPVVTCSHFLPRWELLFRDPAAAPGTTPPDRAPSFNFSRVAGTRHLDGQIRRLGSRVHVYGHQHRNRWRVLDGVLYVSHCLGYPAEAGCGSGAAADRPRVVWEGGG